MAGHVVNASTKFKGPTAIRSWVMISDISHIYDTIDNAFASTAHAPYHVIYA